MQRPAGDPDEPLPPYIASDPLHTLEISPQDARRHSVPGNVEWEDATVVDATPVPPPAVTPSPSTSTQPIPVILPGSYPVDSHVHVPPAHTVTVNPQPILRPQRPPSSNDPLDRLGRVLDSTLNSVDARLRQWSGQLSQVHLGPAAPPPPSVHIPSVTSHPNMAYVAPVRQCWKCHDTGWKPSGRPCRRCEVGRLIQEELARTGRVRPVVRICGQCRGTGRIEVKPLEWKVPLFGTRVGTDRVRAWVECNTCMGRGSL